jgi:hypothetical protein
MLLALVATVTLLANLLLGALTSEAWVRSGSLISRERQQESG